jgi:hypothetical protein
VRIIVDNLIKNLVPYINSKNDRASLPGTKKKVDPTGALVIHGHLPLAKPFRAHFSWLIQLLRFLVQTKASSQQKPLLLRPLRSAARRLRDASKATRMDVSKLTIPEIHELSLFFFRTEIAEQKK